MKKNALLATDMDGTVIPLDNNKKRSAEIRQFNKLIRQNEHLCLAYVTGRHLELGLEGVTRHSLPLPDIFVCDVGTSIYHRAGTTWKPDADFHATLKKAWHGLNGVDIAGLLKGLKQLTPQEEERQQEFKQSYYTSLDEDHRQIEAAIRERLMAAAIKANVIYSVDTLKNVGLVDVLPVMAAKDYALEYLWQSLGFSHDKIVYAGDSGNDLLAFVSGFNAIIVNNTTETVKEEVRRLATEKNIENRIFFATHKFVGGVMEGCYHFKLFNKKGI